MGTVTIRRWNWGDAIMSLAWRASRPKGFGKKESCPYASAASKPHSVAHKPHQASGVLSRGFCSSCGRSSSFPWSPLSALPWLLWTLILQTTFLSLEAPKGVQACFTVPSSVHQCWLHCRITWGAFKKLQGLGFTSQNTVSVSRFKCTPNITNRLQRLKHLVFISNLNLQPKALISLLLDPHLRDLSNQFLSSQRIHFLPSPSMLGKHIEKSSARNFQRYSNRFMDVLETPQPTSALQSA